MARLNVSGPPRGVIDSSNHIITHPGDKWPPLPSLNTKPWFVPGCSVVLVGDPQQLPATVKSRAAQALQLERSLFERIQVCTSVRPVSLTVIIGTPSNLMDTLVQSHSAEITPVSLMVSQGLFHRLSSCTNGKQEIGSDVH